MLATKIPERKFDFSLDYQVINDLGLALLRPCADRDAGHRARSGVDFLKKTIAAYRRTLAIDSEDVAAHYGLGQAYGDPAWGDKTIARVAGRCAKPAPAAMPSRSTPTRS